MMDRRYGTMTDTEGTMLPLEGIKVVEIAQNLAGPYAGAILAALGADGARGGGPPFWRGTSPAFLTMNRDKRSIALDLKDPAAVAWLMAYLDDADVLVENLRPGVLEALGLGPDALLAS